MNLKTADFKRNSTPLPPPPPPINTLFTSTAFLQSLQFSRNYLFQLTEVKVENISQNMNILFISGSPPGRRGKLKIFLKKHRENVGHLGEGRDIF